MKCHRCGRKISDDQRYKYQGHTFCEDCLMEIGLHSGQCQPWASYLATHTRESLGMKGTEGLTELQKKVYEFIKDKSKTTREDIKQNLNLSEADLDAQLTPLMHSELVKERGEEGNIYLVAVN
jgi:late competence protein required for DNA uptake (superfamily II DNA/RNA helicase)